VRLESFHASCPIPHRATKRRMLARIANSAVLDFTYIKRVRQDLVDVTGGKG
jgi:hypothetical protein